MMQRHQHIVILTRTMTTCGSVEVLNNALNVVSQPVCSVRLRSHSAPHSEVKLGKYQVSRRWEVAAVAVLETLPITERGTRQVVVIADTFRDLFGRSI